MRIVTGRSHFPRTTRPVLTIGAFDGVHRAHQALLRHTMDAAKRCRGTAVALTFDPHPQHVLRAGHLPQLLSRLDQRLEWFRATGIDLVWIIRFTKSFARCTPQQFISRVLSAQAHAQQIIVGRSFGFGRQRRGDSQRLQQLAHAAGIDVHVVPDVLVGDSPVNSSRIRSAIRAGLLSQAARLLGRPYILRGTVIRGAARGRRLGFPTANVAYAPCVLPPYGVYVVEVTIGRRLYPAVANVGMRPTFGTLSTTVEVHLLKTSQYLYGRHIDIAWLRRLRPERKFPTTKHLQRQIARDIQQTETFFRHHSRS